MEKSKIILIIIILLLIFFYGAEIKNKSFSKNCEKIIVFLNFSDLHCSFCIKSFTEFCSFVKKNNINSKINGILIIQDKKRIKKKIINKQLKGFVKGNNIDFPVAVDWNNVFSAFAENYDLIVINNKEKQIKGFKFINFLNSKKDI